MKKTLLALVLSGLILAIGAVVLVQQNQERRTKSELKARMYAFVGIVHVAANDGETALREKNLIGFWKKHSGVMPACNLQTCGGVRKSSIAEDGSVSIVLDGSRALELDGKSVVLSPVISNRTVTWKCRTNAPAQFLPAAGEESRSFWNENVEPCSAAT